MLERETGLESVYYSHCSPLLDISHYFSWRHDAENHFSSCLILQNLGKSGIGPSAKRRIACHSPARNGCVVRQPSLQPGDLQQATFGVHLVELQPAALRCGWEEEIEGTLAQRSPWASLYLQTPPTLICN
jgi:hypothetical protein